MITDYNNNLHDLPVQVPLGIHSKQSIFNLFPGLAFVDNSDNIKNVNVAVGLTDVRQRSDWGCRFFLVEGRPLYLYSSIRNAL